MLAMNEGISYKHLWHTYKILLFSFQIYFVIKMYVTKTTIVDVFKLKCNHSIFYHFHLSTRYTVKRDRGKGRGVKDVFTPIINDDGFCLQNKSLFKFFNVHGGGGVEGRFEESVNNSVGTIFSIHHQYQPTFHIFLLYQYQ